MMADPLHLLILGGTGEARELADRAVAGFGPRLRVVTSLAGRTAEPASVAGEVRHGGFGGAAGLARHLRAAAVDLLIDATHPFAAQISADAAAAAAEAGVPRLALVRPPWPRHPDDRWTEVADAAAAAAAVEAAGYPRVWLTVGLRDIDAFAGCRETFFLVRRVDPPPAAPPLARHLVVLGRGPFAIADEERLLAEHRIDALVCRASGGAATEAKLAAARARGLPVVMIRRPPAPPGPAVATPDEALAWLRAKLGS